MGNRTFEADRDGRISIYPSLYGPTGKGLIRKTLEKIFSRLVKPKK